MQTNLTCPLTKLIFNKPVACDDGHIYEEIAIMRWLSKCSTSPITGKAMGKHYYNVATMEQIVTDYIQKNPDEKKNQYPNKIPYLLHEDEFRTCVDNHDDVILMKFTGIPLNEVLLSGKSLLTYVCELCSPDVIKHILDNAFDYDTRNANKKYPIHVLIEETEPEIIAYFLDTHTFDINVADIIGQKPIDYVLRYHPTALDLFKKFISYGATINHEDINHKSPIHYILDNGNYEAYILFKSCGMVCWGIGYNNLTFLQYSFKYCNNIKIIIDMIDGESYVGIDPDPILCAEEFVYVNSKLSKTDKRLVVHHYLNKILNIITIDNNYMNTLTCVKK